MTRRSGTGRPKRLAAAVVAGWLLLIPATLAGTGGRLFLPLAGAFADGSGLPGAGDLLAAARTATSDPEDYGASGTLPDSDTLSPELLAALANAATDPNALAGLPGTGAGPLASVPPGPLGLPGVMLDAYVRAAEGLRATYPGCNLHWSVLAAIGRIESGHANGGAVDAQGTTVRPILGPVLAGGPGMAAIPDTDGGLLDGNTVWDRAVGPMQFIPSTWSRYATDGNNDGSASPHNIYDATLAAGRYLCSGGGDLSNPVALAQAVFRYNHSDAYVANVLSWAAAYASGVTPLPSAPVVTDPAAGLPPVAGPPVTTPPGTTTPPSSTTTTTTTTTTTGGSTTTTTTETCPPPPTSTDPSSTTPTPPPGCETTTTPPPSSETPPPPTSEVTQTQVSSETAPASETATQAPSSADTSDTSSAASSDTSAASSAETSSGDTAAAASTTTSMPAS